MLATMHCWCTYAHVPHWKINSITYLYKNAIFFNLLSLSYSGMYSTKRFLFFETDNVGTKHGPKHQVQSFFRGWLCRRRWKQIVDDYINSPHAESMRKRNSLVFSMVEAEEEYVEQLEVLVSCFLRPFKMAASSKRPPCSHEDVNSIFLNSETVLFLHQIFLKGLTSRLESWPTLVLGTIKKKNALCVLLIRVQRRITHWERTYINFPLFIFIFLPFRSAVFILSLSPGDLFDMLLPMLSIYQEYVRNHHYSLQVLTECKSRQEFSTVLRRLEAKSVCKGRSLEMFLTYPMHQVCEEVDERQSCEKLIYSNCFFFPFTFLLLLSKQKWKKNRSLAT